MEAPKKKLLVKAVNIRLEKDPELRQYLEFIAARDHRTMSSYLKQLIADDMNKNKEVWEVERD